MKLKEYIIQRYRKTGQVTINHTHLKQNIIKQAHQRNFRQKQLMKT